jgi:hypothetical protein
VGSASGTPPKATSIARTSAGTPSAARSASGRGVPRRAIGGTRRSRGCPSNGIPGSSANSASAREYPSRIQSTTSASGPRVASRPASTSAQFSDDAPYAGTPIEAAAAIGSHPTFDSTTSGRSARSASISAASRASRSEWSAR